MKERKTKEILDTYFHSPLCIASLHKIKAVRDALPNPRYIVPYPCANNQEKKGNLKKGQLTVFVIHGNLRTHPNEIEVSVATQPLHATGLMLSKMLLLLP